MRRTKNKLVALAALFSSIGVFTIAAPSSAATCLNPITSTEPGRLATKSIGVASLLNEVTPVRVMDTRPVAGGTYCYKGGASASKLSAGQAIRVALKGFVPVDTTAVVVNLTMDQEEVPPTPKGDAQQGFASVFPCDNTPGDISNINYANADTRSVSAFVMTGSDGDICVYSQRRSHVILDLKAYFHPLSGRRFTPQTVKRLFDTRDGLGGVPARALNPGETLQFPIAGDIAAMNIASTDALAPGFVTQYPCASPRSTTSDVNVPNAGEVTSNFTLGGIKGGSCFYSFMRQNLLVDLIGVFSDAGTYRYFPAAPRRIVDSRSGKGFNGQLAGGTNYGPNFCPSVGLSDGPNARVFVFSTTATEAVSDGFITLYNGQNPRPLASAVNYRKGTTVANLAMVQTDVAGCSIGIYASQSTQLLLDFAGYFEKG